MSWSYPQPALSVVVTLVSGRTEDLAACLQSLRDQDDAPAQEILVPYDDPCSDVTRLSESYPDVRFVRALGLDFAAARSAGSHAPYDVLRTIGLKAARGTYVALTEDHARLERRWCRTLFELLERNPEVGAVGGAMACGSNRLLNRAICYCDFGRYQNPIPEGPAAFVSDSNVLYRRQALDEIRMVWESGFREFPVHRALVAAGRPIWLTPRTTAWQNRGEMTLRAALKERYVWGRAFGGVRFDGRNVRPRLLYACLCPVLPFLLTWRFCRKALSSGNRPGEFFTVIPFIVLLSSFWAAGEFVGYVTGRADSVAALPGACPGTTAAAAR
jgi:hypothetical protein